MKAKYNLRYRGYYEIEDTLLGIDNLAIVYVGIGGGKISEKNGDLITGNLAKSQKQPTNWKDSLEWSFRLEATSFGT